VWLASAAALVGIATGIFTLRDQLFRADKPPVTEVGSQSVPYFDNVVSHLDRSKDFIAFLQQHDGDAVRLQAGFQILMNDFSVKGFGDPPPSGDTIR
jgi:hypothetical protein